MNAASARDVIASLGFALVLAIPPAVRADDATLSQGEAPVAAPAPAVMSVAEALEHAMKHGSLIEAAKGGTAVFEAKLKAAQALAWPHVEGIVFGAPKPREYGPAGQGETDFSTWGILARAEVSGYVPLYTFEKISRLKDAATLGIEVGRAQETIAAAETRFMVLKAAYGLSLARELTSVIAEGREYLEKARKRIDELSKSDDPSFDPVDRMKLRVYDAQVLAKELEAKRAVDLSEALLRTAIGLTPDDATTFRVTAPAPVEPRGARELDALVFQALEERPELVAIKKGVAAKRALVDAKRAAYWPDLLAVGMARYTYSNVSDRTGMDDPYNGYAAGAGLAIRFDLDIAKKQADVREAEAELGKLEAEAVGAERGVRLEVTKLFREMADGRALVDAQLAAKEAARGWVIAKTDLYENGLADMDDVLTALVAFFQARIDQLRAIHDFNVAVAALERATGARLIPLGE
jgi:outer membrane protein TolC